MRRFSFEIPLLLGTLLLTACASAPVVTLTPPIAEGEGTRTHTSATSAYTTQTSYTGSWKAGRPQGQGTFSRGWAATGSTDANPTTCSGEFGDQFALAERPPGIFFSKEALQPGGDWIFGRGTIKSMQGHTHDTVYHGSFLSNLSGGLVCFAYGSGKLANARGSVSGTFNNGLQPGPCVVEEKGQGSLAGTCSNDPQGTFKAIPYEVVAAAIYIKNYYTLVSGPAVYTDPSGVRYEGTFNRSLAKSGTYRVTRPGADTVVAYYDNNTLLAEHPSQDTLDKRATRCGNWSFMSGTCPGGQWSGAIVAYRMTDNGMWRLQGRFDKNVPRGPVEMELLQRDYKIRGTMAPVVTGQPFNFSQGEIWNQGVVTYKGNMKGINPEGTGLCRHEGQLEACEYAEGQRVDALFKMRAENRKMAQQLQLQQQQQQQQAAPRANADSGFQWGKLAALGTGAAIGGINKLSSEAQAKVLSGMVQDSMGGQQGMGSTQAALNNQGGASAGSAGSAGSGGSQNTAALKQAAASCANEYDGPNNDPQTDSFCKLAAYNACIHRKTGVTDVDAQGRSSCQQLRGLLNAAGSKNYQCRYCPYPY